MYGISFSAYGAITSPGVIAGNQTGVSGYKPATITSTSAATVSSGSPSPGYGWDLSIDGLTWTNITGATSATYAPPLGITQTTYYRRKARNTTSGAWEAYSNVVVKAVCGLSLSLTPTNPTCGSSNGSIVAVGTNGLGGTGSATIQGWFEIPGGDVSNLTSNGAYPNNPSYSSTVNFVESPSNVLDRFGGRINGYIIPDKTGVHYFWISSDDSGEFWLSTDSNPANKIKRAFNTSYTSIKEWNNANNTNQKSAGISLTAGQIYYFETLYKENGGDDHLAVGWSKPGESTATPSELIPGTDLRPYSVAAGTDPVYQYKTGSGAYQNSGIFPNLAAGSYTITVKDSYGCTTELQQTLTSPAAISTTITSNSPVCSGSTLNLSAGAVTGGGTETPNYSWSGPNGIVPNSQGASVTFSNVTPNTTGIYTLTVNRGACSGTFTTSVNIVAVPSATITSTNPTCGSNDGTITFTFPSNLPNGLSISLNGGTSYAYSVTAGSRSYMITGQAAGTKNIKMKWTSGTACETATTNLTMTAGTGLPPLAINTPGEIICKDPVSTNYTLNSNATGSGPYSLQWEELNGSTWSNISLLGTGTSYSKLAAPGGSKSYRLRASLAGCTTTYSNVLTVTVIDQPIATAAAPVSSICLNQTTTLTSSVNGGSGSAGYQWQRSLLNTALDWSDIPSATSASYSPPTTSAGTYYYRAVVAMSGSGCGPVNSNSVPITVIDPGTTVTPATTTLCVGGTQILTASGTYARVWQRSSDNGATWVDLTATTPTFSPDNSSSGTFKYRVKVNVPSCGIFFSSEATIVVNTPPVVSVSTTRPDVCVGGSATLTGTVTNRTGTPSYQWMISTSENGTYSNVTNGTGGTTDSYTPVTTTAGTFYYKLRANSPVSGCGPVDSPVLIFDVMPPLSVDVTASSTQICQNSINSVTADLKGGVGPFTYQWQLSTSSATSGFSNVAGATSANYQFPTSTVGTRYYKILVTPAAGLGCNAVTSTGYPVTILPLPTVSVSNTSTTGVYPVSTPAVSTSQCLGTLFTLFANSSSSPVPVSSYAWSGSASFSSSEQNPTALAASVSTGGFYTVTVTGSNQCTNTAQTEVKINSNCDGRCTGIIDVRPTNPSTCTATDGSITVTEWNANLYETSMDGYNWYPTSSGSNSEKVFTTLGLGRHLVYLRDKTSRIICRTVYITLEAKSAFSSAPIATNANACKSATGSIALPTDVLSTDRVSWISSRNPTYVLASSLPQVGGKRIIQNLTPGTYYVKVIRGTELCYREQMVTVGNSGSPCVSNQICTTTNLVNLFPNGDFGSGTTKHGPVLTGAETQYGYSLYNCNAPNDGFYTIVNNTDCDGAGGKTFGGAGGAGGWDVLYQDHTTGDTGGYMMVVNASHNPDIVIEKSISNLCPKTQYNFTAWIYNLIPNEDIKPNLSFLIDGVVYYVTGNITTNGWKQVGFSFTTGNITSSVFSIRNNAPGGDGNDWVIDDIVVSKCPMNITMNANVVACVGTASKTITATVADPYQEYVYYKWQESSNNGASWTDISTVASGTYSGGNMTVSTIITGPFTYAHSGKKYRIKLATTASSIDDATCSVASAEATLTVPQITSTITAPIEKCAGTGSTTLTASGGGGTAPYTYSWSDALGSTASVTVNPAATKSYTVTVTDANGCSTTATTQITIKPLPVASATGTTICSGETYSVTPTTSIAGTKYTWTISIISGSVTGQQAQTAAVDGPFAQVLTNTGTVNAVVRYTVTPVANGCSGTPFPFDVTVRPVPAVNNISNQAVCSGLSTTAVTFGGTGTSYSWTNNNTTIGLASGGTGNINAFTGVNAGNAPITATITVTPIANGCSGPSKTFTITVNPIPTLDQPDNQVLCAGGTTNAVNFTGSISGTTFSWTNNTTSIGLATSGTGNINAFTATNAGTTPVTATIIVTPSSNGCAVAPKTFTITVSPKPVVNLNLPSASVCINVPVILTATINGGTSGLTRKWQSSANGSSGWTDVSGQTGLSLIVPTGTPGDTYYRMLVNDPAAGCGEVASAASKVTVFPQPTVTTPGNKVLCTASSSGTISFNGTVSGTTYSWTNNNTATGLATSGTGNIASFTATNTTSAAITSTITVTPTANGCAGDPVTFTITVNPKPTVIKPADQTLCVGATSTAITFAGAVTGTTYSWTNNNIATGLATSGTGSIASFTATNATSAAITSTITVTPTANGCAGDPVTFTITVSPKPTVIKPADQTLCVGATSTAITFAGAVTGTTYSWTNNNTATGLATSGTGSIASFTATNATSAAITSTITVTPTANGCAGDPVTFTITVNPTPSVVKPSNQALCASGSVSPAVFSGPVSGTTYTWINNNPSIGLAGSGTGNIGSFTAINNGTTPVTATITVTPKANDCPGTSQTFTITVYPKPTVSVSIPSETVCVGTPLTLTASVSGGSGNTSQKWQISSDGNTWTDIVGQTGMTYTVPTNASSEKYYQIVITDNGSGCGSITSVPSKITVISTVTIGITPNNNQVCIGETLTLTASINNAAQGLTYQWYSSPNQSDTTRLTGQTGLTLTVPTNIKGIMYYRLQVTSPVTGCGTVKSGFTSVEVRPLPAVTFTKTDALCETGNGKIVFSFQDEPGQTTLEFSLDGGLTYPYSVNDNSGSFTVNALSSSTYQLYARWGGGACPVNLGTTTISDRPAPLATSLKTDPTCTISNGTIRFNFQDVAGRTGYKFSLDGGLTYLATVADNSGSVTYSGLAPGTYDLWVKWDNNECPVNLPDLTLTDQRGPVVNLGQDLEICNGVAVNITAATTGGTPALIYSWNNGLNGVPSHQVSPTITTTYIVTVKDANNCTSKDTLQIIVNANPVLTIANAEVCENQNIRLTSSGGGTYAWTGPNSFVSALQNPEIVNANAGLHAGVYSLTITNGFGCHTSGTMTVIVNALPAPPTLTGAEKCGPGSLTLNASGCSGTISWFDKIFDGNNVGIGTTFATPTLSETTAYFALCSSTKNCDSPVRSSVLAKINNQPVAEIIPVDPTCLGVQSANNGRIIITRYRDNEKYSFNIGTTYNSGLANVPALIPSNGTISTTIPNPSNNASENYTIRIISNEGCTIDRVIKIDNKCIDCPVDYCPPSTITKIE